MSDTPNLSISNNTKITAYTHTQEDDAPLTVPSVGALPTAGVTFRGKTVFIPGTSSTADTFYICLKSATNTYSWKAIIGG